MKSVLTPFFYGIILAPVLVFSLSFSSCKSSAKDKEVVLILQPGPDNPRNSEGDFIDLEDGRILFIYTHYTGMEGDDNSPAYLASRYSDDGGKTWSSEDQKVIEQEGLLNVMSVSLLRLKNGEIALFYLKIDSATSCIPVVRFSSDEAKTWSDPIPCITDKPGYFVLNNNRVIQLKNGRLVFAVALHQVPGQKQHSRIGRLWGYYSDDNGRNWTSTPEIANPDSIETQEPGVVELTDKQDHDVPENNFRSSVLILFK
jgi:sialidase-1